jgi:hypothetical protein
LPGSGNLPSRYVLAGYVFSDEPAAPALTTTPRTAAAVVAVVARTTRIEEHSWKVR